MHQPYRPVPNSQVKEIAEILVKNTRQITFASLASKVLPSVFLHSTPSFDFSFGWIGDRSGLDRSAIHPKLKSNDADESEDSSYLFLSATRERCLPTKLERVFPCSSACK